MAWAGEIEQFPSARNAMLQRIVGSRKIVKNDLLNWISAITYNAMSSINAVWMQDCEHTHGNDKWFWAQHVARRFQHHGCGERQHFWPNNDFAGISSKMSSAYAAVAADVDEIRRCTKQVLQSRCFANFTWRKTQHKRKINDKVCSADGLHKSTQTNLVEEQTCTWLNNKLMIPACCG